MRHLFFLFFLLTIASNLLCQVDSVGQKHVVKRQLVSSQTGMPLSYVTILVSGSSKAVMSDVMGFFTLALDEEVDSIEFKRLSLKEKILSKGALTSSSIIELDELDYQLEDVFVTPTYSNGHAVMEQVRNRFMSSNPDMATDYSCYIYNKMVFDIDSVKLRGLADDADKIKLLEYARNNHLLIIESVTERLHLKKGRTIERVITGRTSGFRDPSLEFVPSQIQPFAFSNAYISLLSTDYLNPISPLGLKMYEFKLTDTLYEASGDTLYYISFAPKSKLIFKSLTGYFQIKSGSYDIVKVNAKGYSDESNHGVSLTQRYTKEIASGYYFPSLLEAKVELGTVSYGAGSQMPLIGTLKSYLTNINISPLIEKEAIARERFYQPSYYSQSDSIFLTQFRPEPLTAKEEKSYLGLDSIGSANQFDSFVDLGRSLAEGYVPAGYVKIDYTRIVDYNREEGLALGLGLETSDKLSEKYSVGGYYRYGFEDKAGKWGVIGRYIWKPEKEYKLDFGYKDDLIPTGSYNFLDGFVPGTSESFKRFSLTGMDLYKQVVGRVEGRFLRDIKGALFTNWNKTTNTSTYYDGDSTLMNSESKQMSFWGSGLGLRWAKGEEFVKSSIRRRAVPGFMHYVWLNYSFIYGHLEQTNFSGHKVEAQLEKRVRIGPSTVATVRVVGGSVIGQLPFTLNYKTFGTYAPIGLDVPYTLATMRPQEFMADRFFLSFIRYKIPFLMHSFHKFKPVLYLNGATAWGKMSRYDNASFEKGYYEGGVVIDNLFKLVFVKYGLGLYYRMGSYQLPNSQDNWAFKVSVEFVL